MVNVKKRVFIDKLLVLFVFALFGVFRPDFVVMSAWIFLIPYLFLTKRKDMLKHFLLVTIIAGIWTFIARAEYNYNYEFMNLNGINLYPFFGWSAGLLGVYLIFAHYRDKLKNKSFTKQIYVFLPIYWFLLLLGETVAYHVFDVRNLVTAFDSALPICNCMHAPNWMKFAYFSLGPLFFGISYLVGWEKAKKY